MPKISSLLALNIKVLPSLWVASQSIFRAGEIAQWHKSLLGQCKVLSSISGTKKKKKDSLLNLYLSRMPSDTLNHKAFLNLHPHCILYLSQKIHMHSYAIVPTFTCIAANVLA